MNIYNKIKNWLYPPKEEILTTDKIIVAGLGRAGTSFIVQLLTLCGANTGFRPQDIHKKGIWSQDTRSGLETYVDWKGAAWKEQKLPQVIKDPLLSQNLDVLVKQGFPICHVFVPIRPIDEIINSRRSVRLLEWLEKNEKERMPVEGVSWGFYFYKVLGKLFHDLETLDIPYTVLNYPRLTQDARYFWDKIAPIHSFLKVDYDKFKWIFHNLSWNKAEPEKNCEDL